MPLLSLSAGALRSHDSQVFGIVITRSAGVKEAVVPHAGKADFSLRSKMTKLADAQIQKRFTLLARAPKGQHSPP